MRTFGWIRFFQVIPLHAEEPRMSFYLLCSVGTQAQRRISIEQAIDQVASGRIQVGRIRLFLTGENLLEHRVIAVAAEWWRAD